ncbi:MAG: glycoside hydrolase family 95 protein, partial [Calditrichales bacterium]
MRYLGMLVFFVWIILFSACSKDETCGSQQSELKLWYKQPASKWVEALPVGNGRLGAMVFGKVDSERIQLNEESLWAGTRINNNNPQAAGHLKEIQKLLLAGKNTQAVILAKKYLLGTPPRIRSYQTLADLNLAFRYTADSLSGYRRDLDLSAGISTVRYRIGKTQYTREVFASAPDNSIVVHITTDQPGQINVDMELSREIDANTRFLSERALLMEGQIIDRGEPHRGPPGAHMKFAARLDILQTDGKVTPENGRLQV